MSAEARQWLVYAEENRQVALLYQASGLFNPSFQNAQQTVEKALLDTIYLPSKYPLGSVLPAFTPDAHTARQCLAVGVAIGTTLAFMPPGTFEPITDMVGGGPFHGLSMRLG